MRMLAGRHPLLLLLRRVTVEANELILGEAPSHANSPSPHTLPRHVSPQGAARDAFDGVQGGGNDRGWEWREGGLFEGGEGGGNYESFQLCDRALVVTGPNGGGKTVLLKMLGVAALLVRHGCWVPCARGSRVAYPVYLLY